MSTPSFFHHSLAESDGIVVLSAEESSHATGARRLRVGQRIRLLNGKGLIAEGLIASASRREVSVELDLFRQADSPSRFLTVATAVPKGGRQKVMVDILTQLGVAKIVPLTSQFSISKFDDRVREKWQRYAIEACKQSNNPWLPEMAEQQSFSAFLDNCDDDIMVADQAGLPLQKSLTTLEYTTIVIGPEGGFSELEQKQLIKCGVKPVRLGSYILRTEAAAIAAASQWVQYNETLRTD